ncbi:hypothetical protein P7C73_g768, partial [Tremellales sp. Uapishka_1]
METVNHLTITADRSNVKVVLRALLYAIFFHRNLDNVEPETYEFLETHVTCAPTPALEREITSKIELFSRTFVDTGRNSGEIAVVFLQRIPKKGWFAITEELVPWEEHLISIRFPSPAPSRSQKPLPNPLPGALIQLLTFCAEKKANVPPLSSGSADSGTSHQASSATTAISHHPL